MYTVFDKFYLARLLLSLNAGEVATQAGITPITISLPERAEKKDITAEYLNFLYEKGVDIFRESSENDIKDAVDQLKKLNLTGQFHSHKSFG